MCRQVLLRHLRQHFGIQQWLPLPVLLWQLQTACWCFLLLVLLLRLLAGVGLPLHWACLLLRLLLLALLLLFLMWWWQLLARYQMVKQWPVDGQ